LLLGRLIGWSRTEIRAMRGAEYLGYLAELPEIVERTTWR
jgi:hypothetical protein